MTMSHCPVAEHGQRTSIDPPALLSITSVPLMLNPPAVTTSASN